jgi:phage regulator Rha-like protein
MRDIRGYVKVLEDSPILDSHNFFIESTYINSQNKEQPCYLLTRKGCDMVANKMTGEKGILFTATYVTKFEDMETEIKSNVPQISREEELALAVYHGGMAAIEATKEITQLKVKEATAPLKKKIEEDEHLVSFGKQIEASKDSVDVGTFSKIIRKENIPYGRNDLFKWLREQKYIKMMQACRNL